MPRPTPDERFWAKVNKTETCWLWTGTTYIWGYGEFNPGGGRSPMAAHRYAYKRKVGPIPEGLHIDHLCKVRLCVNPSHLEAVTPKENARRSGHAIKTHCVNGHPFDEANTRLVGGGWRQCRECSRARYRKRSARRQAEIVEQRTRGRTP